MKVQLKIVLITAVAAFGCLAFLPTRETSAAATIVTQSSPYSNHCARCHGADGRSDTAKGRELDADDLTTGKVQNMSSAKMSRIIKNGKGDMPGFKNLSASQIASIIRKVKSF